MTPEGRFSQKFKKRLDELPKTWSAKIVASSKSGTPDWLICVNGRFIGAELKVKGNGCSLLQLYTLEKINLAGGLAIVVYPDTLDEAIAMIKAIGGI